ncbi:ISL3 family transposase [Bremerella sp. JC817]|uniref:ISL3 family transposase n=1 Tax=Bremerella sp. JC817 TaxID=3231756 RepID=UPI0034597F98
MQDKELYQHLLGLKSPWFVSQVALDVDRQQIDVHVEHPPGTKFCCPECDAKLACYDHAPQRSWRHLDSCQFKTILHAAVPRVNCPQHGVKQADVSWAEKGSRFTILFERLAIDVLLATQTVTGAMQILRTNWDQTWNVIQRAVARGKLRKQAQPKPRIGIDEKAFAKGHNYITLLYDLDASTVEAIADGHDTESGIACLSQLSDEQIASVEAIAMDMCQAYVHAAQQTIPLAEAKIVHDRFHVMQLATKAVDQVRKGEHRQLQQADDHRLAKTKYVWLKSQENLTEKQQSQLDQAFTLQLETGKAWAYKEMLRDLWEHADASSAPTYFKDWYRRVIHTKLAPMKKVARTIKERLANVVSYCTHGITNAVAEGINSKIMAIKRRVGGYRNRENFKTAIFFHCGGLNLYP